jgi:HEAT repeat protein
MSDLLDRAREAAEAQDWSLLRQHLERLLNIDPPTSSHCTGDQDLQRSLDLALEILQFGDFQAQWDVAKLFSAFGSAAVTPLTALLQDEEAEFEARWFAARLLGEANHPQAMQALIETLEHSDDEDLSAIAAEALANVGPAAIAALAELLTQVDTRPLAVAALAKIRSPETIAPLLSLVDDPEPSLRATAIEALGSFHDPRVPPVLVTALADPAAQVRQAAIEALGVRKDLAAELDLVNLLSDRLWDLNLAVCQRTAIALGRLDTEAAANSLFRAFQSPNTPEPLQQEIVRSLGWIGDAIALNYLQQALAQVSTDATSRSLYQEIATLLGRWSEPDLKPQAAQVLIDALETHAAAQDPTVKPAIALALGQLGQSQAMPALIAMLADDNASLRLHTIAALKILDPELAYQQLKTISTQANLSAPLQQGVAIALQEWQQASVRSSPD